MKIFKNNTGSTMIMVLIVLSAISASAFFIPDLLKSNKQIATKSLLRFEATLLARDLVEVGKYLILYSPIARTDNPSSSTDSNLIFSTTMLSKNLSSTCEASDTVTSSNLNFLDGHGKILCTQQLRSSLNSAISYEAQFVANWTKTSSSCDSHKTGDLATITDNLPLKCLERGVYTLKEPMKFSKEQIQLQNNIINIPLTETSQFYGRLSNDDDAMTINFTFYTIDSGYISKMSERYVKITSTVKFNPLATGSSETIVKIEKSFLISTPKATEFALFFSYPHHGSYQTAQSQFTNDTSTLNQSIALPSSSEIHGKTFFNGKINLANLATTPTYLDSVVITKSMSAFRPNQFEIDKVKKKFKKGIIQNIGPQLIYSNTPVPGNPLLTFNSIKAGYHSISSNITSYSLASSLPASCPNINLNDKYRFTVTASSGNGGTCQTCSPSNTTGCTATGSAYASGDFGLFVDGKNPIQGVGIEAVNISATAGPATFIAAPVGHLSIAKAGNIYGTILGGRITSSATGATKIYSPSNIYAGLPGITDQTAVENMNGALYAVGLVSFPLENLPSIIEKEIK